MTDFTVYRWASCGEFFFVRLTAQAYHTCLESNMESITSMFDDVRRMNKRQVHKYTIFLQSNHPETKPNPRSNSVQIFMPIGSNFTRF